MNTITAIQKQIEKEINVLSKDIDFDVKITRYDGRFIEIELNEFTILYNFDFDKLVYIQCHFEFKNDIKSKLKYHRQANNFLIKFLDNIIYILKKYI